MPETPSLVVRACDGRVIQVDVRQMPEDVGTILVCLIGADFSQFSVTKYVEILGQVYRDTAGNITLLGIRVTTLRDDFGKGGYFMQSTLVIFYQRFGLSEQGFASNT